MRYPVRKGKLEIYEDSKHEWRWRLKAPNGRIVATSGEGYTRRSDCVSAQRKISVTMRDAKIVEV